MEVVWHQTKSHKLYFFKVIFNQPRYPFKGQAFKGYKKGYDKI